MARPMPRVEPVMTATFPDMSNKVMRFLPGFCFSLANYAGHCEEP
jgi:hypothetical protein